MSEQKPSRWEGAVLANNNLQDWIIEDAIDGYCWYNQQRIQRIPGDKALFLHEIAHALCHEEGEIGEGFHGGRWADVYQQLVAAEFIALEAKLKATRQFVRWVLTEVPSGQHNLYLIEGNNQSVVSPDTLDELRERAESLAAQEQQE